MKKGDTFEQEFVLSAEVYSGFISVFKDHNPLHTDKGFAVQQGFASEVMHGNILNGFLSYFIGECLPLKNVMIQTQDIKFFKPVYLHDKLVLKAEVADVFDSVKVVELKYGFYRGDEKMAGGKINIGIL